MTCRDFERKWNEGIDALAVSGGGAACDASTHGEERSVDERLLLEHEANCPACRHKAAQLRTLQNAIRAWAGPPAAPPGLADRVLRELDRPEPTAWPVYTSVSTSSLDTFWQKLGRSKAASTAAAVLALAAGLVFLMMPGRVPRNRQRVVFHVTPSDQTPDNELDSKNRHLDYRALNIALADATDATWDLARSASLPAARITRQVIDVATTSPESRAPVSAASPASDSNPVAVPVPSLESLAPDSAAAAAMLQQVGDSFAGGVQPLTTTARHAFGFLLGPAPAKPTARPGDAAEKGA